MTEAGACTLCGGKVFHRDGKPGEFDHECTDRAYRSVAAIVVARTMAGTAVDSLERLQGDDVKTREAEALCDAILQWSRGSVKRIAADLVAALSQN